MNKKFTTSEGDCQENRAEWFVVQKLRTFTSPVSDLPIPFFLYRPRSIPDNFCNIILNKQMKEKKVPRDSKITLNVCFLARTLPLREGYWEVEFLKGKISGLGSIIGGKVVLDNRTKSKIQRGIL
jgi:hypothetical protein